MQNSFLYVQICDYNESGNVFCIEVVIHGVYLANQLVATFCFDCHIALDSTYSDNNIIH